MGQSLSPMNNRVAKSPGKSEFLEKLAQKIRMNIPLDEKWTEILREPYDMRTCDGDMTVFCIGVWILSAGTKM